MLLLVSFFSEGQQTHLREINLATGAPTNFVNDIAFDSEGRALLATDRGLFSFNGSEFTPIIKERFIEHVRIIDGVVYYIAENKIFRTDRKKAFLKHATAIRDFCIFKGDFYVLGQDDFAKYKNGHPEVFSNTEGGIRLVSKQDELFVVEEFRIRIWDGENWSFLCKSRIEIQDALLFGGKWTVVSPNKVETRDGTSFQFLDERENRAIRFVTVSENGTHIICSDSLVEIQAKKEKNPVQIRQAELFGNLNSAKIDPSGNVWFLTEGNGIYLAENYRIRTLSSGKPSELNTITSIPYKSETIYTNSAGCFIEKDGVSKKISSEPYEKLLVNPETAELYGATENRGIDIIDLNSLQQSTLDISSGLSHNYIKSWALRNDTLFVVAKRGGINAIHNGVVLASPNYLQSLPFISQIIASDPSSKVLLCYNVNGQLIILNEDNSLSNNRAAIATARLIALRNSKAVLLANDRVQIIDLKTTQSRTFPLPLNLSEVTIQEHPRFTQDACFITTSDGDLEIPISWENRTESHVYINAVYVDGNELKEYQNLQFDYGKYIVRIQTEVVNFSAFEQPVVSWKLKSENGIQQGDLNNNWIELFITQEGNYQLQLNTTSKANLTRLSLSVAAPIWKSIWFWIVISLGSILLVFGLVRWRTSQLKKEGERLNKMVQEKTVQLQERNQDVEQIAYALSHDFKTPLSTVTMLAEIAQTDGIPDEEKNKSLELLEEKATIIATNMSGLIDLLKIDSHNLPHAPLDFSKILREISVSLEQEIAAKNVQYIVSIDPKVNHQGVEAYFYSILHNLIANAVKYSDPNKASSVSVDILQESTSVLLRVIDNGLGMDLSDGNDKIFRPFKQIDSSTDGVGLGLSIVKRMIQTQGGTIEVTSQLGVGTTFILTFPLSKSE